MRQFRNNRQNNNSNNNFIRYWKAIVPLEKHKINT